jgi:F0F1-type ATP synthase membrane subunit b/b'
MFAYFSFLGIVLIVLLPFALIRAEFIARRVRREQLERRRMIERRLQLASEERKKWLDDAMADNKKRSDEATAGIKAMMDKATMDYEQTKSEDIKRRYRRT